MKPDLFGITSNFTDKEMDELFDFKDLTTDQKVGIFYYFFDFMVNNPLLPKEKEAEYCEFVNYLATKLDIQKINISDLRLDEKVIDLDKDINSLSDSNKQKFLSLLFWFAKYSGVMPKEIQDCLMDSSQPIDDISLN